MPITEHDLPAPTDSDRIAQLEEAVAALTAELERPTSDTAEAPDTPPTETNVAPTRRKLFRLAAGAAAAGGAMAVAGSRPAAAADGESVLIGSTRTQGNSGRTDTVIDYENTLGPRTGFGFGSMAANIFLARDRAPGPILILNPDGSTYPAAVAGYAQQAVANGVYGLSTVANGHGVVARGSGPTSAGLLARGQRANVSLFNEGSNPTTRSDAHSRGEIIADSDGRLWYCTADGSPGTWQLLATAGAISAFTAIAASRVFDSRFSTNFPAGSNRTVSVKDSINVDSGVIAVANIVPDGAKAVTANITITNTVGGGFVAINPGGDAVVKGSTINWSANGQQLANAGVFALNTNRQLEVIAGGPAGSSIDAIIDVTGYYL